MRDLPYTVFAFLLIAPLSGCLGISGSIAVLLTTSADEDKDAPPPPPDVTEVFLQSGALPLSNLPSHVVVGDFLPDPGGGRHLDAAVVSREQTVVTFFRGDGTGTLRPHTTQVHLSPDASVPQKLAAVDVEVLGGPAFLLVVTATTLESVRWNSARGDFDVVQQAALIVDPTLRGLTTGDFNGDGIPDAAVSTEVISGVEVFLGRLVGDTYRLERHTSIPVESPRAVVAANFDADPEGHDDLVVLNFEAGVSTLILFLSAVLGDETVVFDERDRLVEPDLIVDFGASLDAKDDSFFENSDDFPDFITGRKRNIGRVLVREAGDGLPKLELPTKPSGPVSRRTAGALLTRLPRNAEPDPDLAPLLWDIVSVDVVLEAAVVTYTEDGLDKGGTVTYGLPGPGWGVAVGDLNEDGLEDVVVVTIDPPTLSTLLSNRVHDRVEERPFYHPLAGILGENLPRLMNLETVGFGYAGFDGERKTLPFVVTELESDVVIQFLFDDESDRDYLRRPAGEPERHFLRHPDGSLWEFRSFEVTDLDADGDDDVVLIDRYGSFFLLQSQGQGVRRFSWYEPEDGPRGVFFDLREAPNLPHDIGEVRLRRFATAFLDEGELPDFIVAASRDLSRDYVAVVFNPGKSLGALRARPEVDFYQTLDDPRMVTVANINGDLDVRGKPALDLVIAIEGSDQADVDPTLKNKVLILFGIPRQPGKFYPLDAGHVLPLGSPLDGARPAFVSEEPAFASRPPRTPRAEVEIPEHLGFGGSIGKSLQLPPDPPIPALVLDNYPGDTEVEVVATDNDAPGRGFGVMAQVLVVSGDHIVSVYFNETTDPRHPTFSAEPCLIYRGSDPETLVFADFCPDEKGLPDLIVADEDRGVFLPMRYNAIPGPDCSPFEGLQGPLLDGRPDELVFATRPDGEFASLISTSKLSHLEIYEVGPCSFERRIPIDLFRVNRSAVSGLATARQSDGSLLVALVVEDAIPVSGEGAVDVVAFPPGVTDGELFAFDAAESSIPRERLVYGDAAQEGEDSPDLDAVLLGRFVGNDGNLDILVHDGQTGEFLLHAGGRRSGTEVPWSPATDTLDGVIRLYGALVCWSPVHVSSTQDAVLVTTENAVYLVRPEDGWRRETLREGTAGTPWAVHGWVGPVDNRLTNLRVAVQTGASVLVHAPANGSVEPLELGVLPQTLGCRDVNGDGADDLVALTRTSVEIFLGNASGFDGTPVSTNLEIPAGATCLEFLDANGDDLRDLCVGSRNGQVKVLLGNGTGAFPAAKASETFAGRNLEALRAADLDGDGIEEILASSETPGLMIIRPAKIPR